MCQSTWCLREVRSVWIFKKMLINFRVILVLWSVGPTCWSVGIIYHWKRTILGSLLVIWMVHWSSMVHSVNDTPSVSMLKDTDEWSVWSDGLQNKHDPVKIIGSVGRHQCVIFVYCSFILFFYFLTEMWLTFPFKFNYLLSNNWFNSKLFVIVSMIFIPTTLFHNYLLMSV